MSDKVYIRKYSVWAPGIESPEEWLEWKAGNREVLREPLAPKLPFVDMLLRRRLSMATKMAVYVNHFVSEGFPKTKITYASEFGEICRQLKISQALIETDMVSPANFSLSVFNAASACASIVEGNMEGYSAGYAGVDSFENGLRDCVSALVHSDDAERIFLFSDELVPEEYAPVCDYPNVPFALALRLSKNPCGGREVDLSLFPKMKFAAEQALWFFRERVI